MKGSRPGKPICSRIRSDSTSATMPTTIAVIEYWMAMTLWSWLQTYLVTQLFGSCNSASSVIPGASFHILDVGNERGHFLVAQLLRRHHGGEALHDLCVGLENGLFQIGVIGFHGRAADQRFRLAVQALPRRPDPGLAVHAVAGHATLALRNIAALRDQRVAGRLGTGLGGQLRQGRLRGQPGLELVFRLDHY